MPSHIALRRPSLRSEEPVRENVAIATPRHRARRTFSSSHWLGFGVRLLFASAAIVYFAVRYFAFVPRAIQP